MTFGFNEAFAEVLPFHMPEIFSWKKDGKPEFTLPGWDVTSRKYLVALSAHKAPLPDGMNFNRVFANAPNNPDDVTRLHVCVPVRPVPHAARRQPRVRLGRR